MAHIKKVTEKIACGALGEKSYSVLFIDKAMRERKRMSLSKGELDEKTRDELCPRSRDTDEM